jgi:PD-(D/E)XK nuclease superfamily protein
MDPLTPMQQRTLDGLMGRSHPRPVFPEDLAERLRDRILHRVGDLPFAEDLWIGKERLNDHGRCEGLYAANLLREGPPFEHGVRSASGLLAHKAIELDVGRERRDPVHEVVERAVERVAGEDGALQAYWEDIDTLQASEITEATVRIVEQFRASFPPLQRSWTPVTEFSLRQTFGKVTVSGRIDLVLGSVDPDEPMRARRLAIDLKSGRAWPEFPEDMRLYALLLTLRHGVPPFRVASLFLDSGEWQAEDVDEHVLLHAADRLARGIQAASRLLAGATPDLRVGPYCAWCPRKGGCTAFALHEVELAAANG